MCRVEPSTKSTQFDEHRCPKKAIAEAKRVLDEERNHGRYAGAMEKAIAAYEAVMLSAGVKMTSRKPTHEMEEIGEFWPPLLMSREGDGVPAELPFAILDRATSLAERALGYVIAGTSSPSHAGASFLTGQRTRRSAYSTFNARSETAASKPAFRDGFKRRRSLVPADGFFEWKRDGKEKQPYLIRMKGGGLFAFAGLWATWNNITSFAIMTAEPNELMADIQNCMPVILGADDHDRWLDLNADPADTLKPCPADWLEAYPVDKRVGNACSNDADLIERQELSS